MNADEYRILREPGHAQTRVLGSRFFGNALPVESTDGIAQRLDEVRKRYFDATHWCHAARIGIGRDLAERSSDAGEPHGTAGPPILREIQRRELTNTLVIVTRWFGGTKLGTGGLVRAYGECAGFALDAATIETCRILAHCLVECPYDDQGTVYAIAHRFQADVKPEESVNSAKFMIECAPPAAAPLIAALREEGRGRIRVEECRS